jgi:hypothetical protein
MKQKRCHCCHELYQPDPRTHRQQKTCTKPSCRTWRKHQAVQRWKLKNPLYAENDPIKQKQWRQNHRGYWKQWRSSHPGYVQRNRKAQRSRNAKNRGLIAKGNEINSICIEKIDQISSLRLIAKGNECHQILFRQVDGICRYLKAQLVIAKRNDIDRRGIFVRQ